MNITDHRRTRALRRRCGFTLIELLVVVAIIAILVLLALPNFQEAQSRAKLARVRAEHRMLKTALEAYAVDQNGYPSAESNGSLKWLRWMTTPVAYISRADMDDPFTGASAIKNNPDRNISYRTYRYYGFNEAGYSNADSASGEFLSPYYAKPLEDGSPDPRAGTPKILFYVLFSHGPDRIRSKGSNGRTFVQSENLFDPDHFIELIYDPTNGTVSNGEILSPGGGAPVGRAAPAIGLVRN